MGEAVWIRGKFKAEKERHAEIQKELIEGLSQYLSPNCFSAEWENILGPMVIVLSWTLKLLENMEWHRTT